MVGAAGKTAPGCIRVVCRDGKTMVDWLEEMLQYTTTQPSISYSCNPLNFDFAQLSAKKATKVPAGAAQCLDDGGQTVEDKVMEVAESGESLM